MRSLTLWASFTCGLAFYHNPSYCSHPLIAVRAFAGAAKAENGGRKIQDLGDVRRTRRKPLPEYFILYSNVIAALYSPVRGSASRLPVLHESQSDLKFEKF